MTEADTPNPGPAPTVFLSYASADREAARLIKDALPTYGLEVWYDESDLGGGEAWDQKIRKQIRECDYFMPLISAQTEARHEGYFRREWRLAVERTLDMADDHAFLLPVAVDDTRQSGARVPEKFLSIQWVRVPGGQPNAALQTLCKRLVSGEPASAQRAPMPGARVLADAASPVAALYPEFPAEGSKSTTRYWLDVVIWALRCAWKFFNRLPRWVRFIVYCWLCIALLSRGCSNDHRYSRSSHDDAAQLNAISDKYHGSFDKSDVTKLATQIARMTSDAAEENPARQSPLLAIPFSAPAGNADAAKLADSTFALVYGKIAIAHPGRVGLSPETVSCENLKSVLERAQSTHSNYVLCGTVGTAPSGPALSIKLAKVSDGSVLWSKSYPVAGADAGKIAEEVNSQVPSLNDD